VFDYLMKKSDFSNPPQHHLILVKASKFQGIFIALLLLVRHLLYGMILKFPAIFVRVEEN